MARPLRVEFSGAIYHRTGRGNVRQKVFSPPRGELFLGTLVYVASR